MLSMLKHFHKQHVGKRVVIYKYEVFRILSSERKLMRIKQKTKKQPFLKGGEPQPEAPEDSGRASVTVCPGEQQAWTPVAWRQLFILSGAKLLRELTPTGHNFRSSILFRTQSQTGFTASTLLNPPVPTHRSPRCYTAVRAHDRPRVGTCPRASCCLLPETSAHLVSRTPPSLFSLPGLRLLVLLCLASSALRPPLTSLLHMHYL